MKSNFKSKFLTSILSIVMVLVCASSSDFAKETHLHETLREAVPQSSDGIFKRIGKAISGGKNLDLKYIETLVSKHPEWVNEVGDDGDTPLSLAISAKRKDVVEYLIKHGANANAVVSATVNGDKELKEIKTIAWCPALFICKGGNFEIADYLLSHGAKIDIPMECITNSGLKFKAPVLYFLLLQEEFELADYLLSHGADANVIVHTEYDSFKIDLPWLCFLPYFKHSSSFKIFEYLLNHGADVNCKDEESWTPLHHVAKWGELKIGELLVNNSADFNLKTKNGKRPIDIANDEGHMDFVQMLLDHGAKISDSPSSGWFSSLLSLFKFF